MPDWIIPTLAALVLGSLVLLGLAVRIKGRFGHLGYVRERGLQPLTPGVLTPGWRGPTPPTGEQGYEGRSPILGGMPEQFRLVRGGREAIAARETFVIPRTSETGARPVTYYLTAAPTAWRGYYFASGRRLEGDARHPALYEEEARALRERSLALLVADGWVIVRSPRHEDWEPNADAVLRLADRLGVTPPTAR